MGKSQRAKGARGQREAREVLESHGYHVTQIACGIKSEDLLAEYDGVTWSVEVKHCAQIDLARFERQAKAQAAERGMPWMLMVRLTGRPHTFLVLDADGARVIRLREQVFGGSIGGDRNAPASVNSGGVARQNGAV